LQVIKYTHQRAGALFILEGIAIDNFIRGAGQEMGRRAGTENVPYIVGLGVACDIAIPVVQVPKSILLSLREVSLGN
jgi:cysteine sulfinate desulfinase/cysteine desulfurase-like protein